MIERLHSHLKTAVMCHADDHWVESLPLVLLEILSAWKNNLKASSAELDYGSPLRLPGEFFAPFPTESTDFASRLRVHILRPIPPYRHAAPSTFIFKYLATSSHVFLKQGGLRGALQAPYVGPYRVLHRSGKTHTIEVHGAETKVSVEHMKPAYALHFNTESASSSASPSSTTTAKNIQ